MNLIDLYLPELNWKEELRLWSAFAIVTVLSLFLAHPGQTLTNLETNEFGLFGDTLIVGLAFSFLVALLILGWAAAQSAMWLCGRMLLAAPLAMLQMQQDLINSKISSLGVSLQSAITHAATTGVNLTICPHTLVSRYLREYPLAKIPSLSKHPYQLFPISCILLN